MSGPVQGTGPGRPETGRGLRGRRALRAIFGGALLVAAFLATGALTRISWEAEPARAELRLSWRTRVPRVEECRTPTAEEQAELPVHMRQAEICEARSAAYRLRVEVDGALRDSATVSAAGARGDRPVYVFRTLPLEPGRRHIRVTFERTDADHTAPTEPGAAARPDQAPERMVFDRTLDVDTHDVVLLTASDGALVRVGGGSEP